MTKGQLDILDKILQPTSGAKAGAKIGVGAEGVVETITLSVLDLDVQRVELPETIKTELNTEFNIRRYMQSAGEFDSEVLESLEDFHSEKNRDEDRTILKWFVPQPRSHGTIAKMRLLDK